MLPTKFQFIWPVVSEEKIFKNGPIRNKNCLVSEEKIFLNRPIRYKNCLLGFQRRRLKCEKLTDDRRQVIEEKIKM